MTAASAVKSSRKGKRRDRRFAVDQQALVSPAQAPDLVWTARIANVSRRGMLLILDQPAHFDGDVRIQWGEEVRGTIRHREQSGGDYRVGVELADRSQSLLLEMLAREHQEVTSSAAELRKRNCELSEALETASRASEIKSRFLASISHEFRTPLNGIVGFSEMLYDARIGPVTADQKECLEDILICSRHLLTLINQVLDLTRIEAGKMDFEYQAVEPEALAREVMEGVKGLAQKKSISVRLECDGPLGPVEADAARFRQVLFNYLSNALKFTAEGGSVAVRVAGDEPGWYRIEVEDNGAGIQLEDISRLFTEFGQLGRARKEGSGTGLGLAITRRIVEEQGGSVGVESAPGKGSRFWAVLPRKPSGR